MSVTVIERPSPNHDARPDGAAISMLVLHYTDLPSAEAALARLCDPSTEVSAHYLIDEAGAIHRLVPEARRAWHAGKSRWRGVEGVNAVSLGIELANPGHSHGYRPFPAAQMSALAALARDLIARHPIPPRNVVGHSDVAPERKLDPGELFDWRRLARAGIGLWPEGAGAPSAADFLLLREGDQGPRVHALRAALGRYGYGLGADDRFDAHAAAVARAFQRHFRADRIDGAWDFECDQRLRALLGLAGEAADD
jgi:N-acetylmuramoyl-L-alanine amidase